MRGERGKIALGVLLIHALKAGVERRGGSDREQAMASLGRMNSRKGTTGEFSQRPLFFRFSGN